LYLPTYQPWVPRERHLHRRKCVYQKAAREIFWILARIHSMQKVCKVCD
jgi:hypothetical protein